jgi:hypothetical protein
MLEDLELKTSNVLLSGGADGADAAFGRAAQAAGHDVVHWTFGGHKTKLRKNLCQLTEEHLAAADPYLLRANKSLVRTYPSSSAVVNDLLRRNLYQVRWSDSVYAVSRFKRDGSLLGIDGGTAWACQMYVDRFIYDQEPMELCNLYLFDQLSNKWHTWRRGWSEIDCPPAPLGIYAGIGSRKLTPDGAKAIDALYQ